MKRFTIYPLVLLLLLAAPLKPAFGQNHGEVGVFADYFRLANANDLNMLGVGGRFSINVHPHVALEAEGAYDFERTQSVTVSGLANPVRASFRATHFLVGPQFTAGKSGPWRIYGVLKGGFVRFGVTPGPVTFGAFPTSLKDTDLNGVFYPGGGLEAFAGILGLRAEIGDEIYFDNGANHNLKITFGPVIRF
jgi:hypothetical protein